ncbi:hypothetical protein GNP63_01410 [Aliivibrio fischeri]|uniref:hypothetical protein n=1 Tax=Aliivibrio fischeri TaxID=668 RepID=UPI0012D9E453|nr:hypothetical protein [Aliivibrio fischeri]MUH95209.1 hypothetical protein [Aliivibrio fischeri]MUI65103.1 hypothetical protein [Aliivibrio fischeri]
MPISNSSLKTKLIKEMNGKGMVTEGEFAKAADLAEAIANAVVEEITSNALVVVDKGSSAGSYSVS